MIEQNQSEEVLDLRVPKGTVFTANTVLKAQLKRVKDLTQLDVSKFKEKKAYRILARPGCAYFINYIGVCPNSGLPMAIGFEVGAEGFVAKPMLLCDLKTEEVFF